MSFIRLPLLNKNDLFSFNIGDLHLTTGNREADAALASNNIPSLMFL